MGEILITVIFAVAIPAVFLPLYFRYKALYDGRKMPYDAVCVKNGVLTAALIFTILLYAATVICGITCTILASARATYISVSVVGAFTVIFALAYLNDKFQYIAAEETGVTEVCIFHKDKIIPYEKIKYYQFATLKGGRVITLFNHNGVPLLTYGTFDQYINKFTQKLDEMGIEHVPDSAKFHTAEMRNSEEYKSFRKKDNYIALIITFTLLCACFMLVFGILFSPSPPDKFINYDVSGIVASYKFSHDQHDTKLNFTLENDEHVYTVNYTTYHRMDKDFEKSLSNGDTLNLLIAYDEADNERGVSQIELNGRVYLHADDVEAYIIHSRELNNKIAFACFGIGCAPFLGTVICVILLCVHKRKCANK